MYAKNNEVPKRFDYPYQRQQRISGQLVECDRDVNKLTEGAVKAIEELVKGLASSGKLAAKDESK